MKNFLISVAVVSSVLIAISFLNFPINKELTPVEKNFYKQLSRFDSSVKSDEAGDCNVYAKTEYGS